jgi:hypothetical protein
MINMRRNAGQPNKLVLDTPASNSNVQHSMPLITPAIQLQQAPVVLEQQHQQGVHNTQLIVHPHVVQPQQPVHVSQNDSMERLVNIMENSARDNRLVNIYYKFAGEPYQDVFEFIDTFEQDCIKYGWSEQVIIIKFLDTLIGAAKLWADGKPASDKLSWTKLRDSFVERFKNAKTAQKHAVRLSKAMWSSESKMTLAYHIEWLAKIMKRVHPVVTQDMLKAQLVHTIRETKISVYVDMLQSNSPNLTYDQFAAEVLKIHSTLANSDYNYLQAIKKQRFGSDKKFGSAQPDYGNNYNFGKKQMFQKPGYKFNNKFNTQNRNSNSNNSFGQSYVPSNSNSDRNVDNNGQQNVVTNVKASNNNREDWRSRNNNRNYDGKPKCGFCNRIGHTAYNCFRNPQSPVFKSNGNSNGGENKSTGGDGKQQQQSRPMNKVNAVQPVSDSDDGAYVNMQQVQQYLAKKVNMVKFPADLCHHVDSNGLKEYFEILEVKPITEVPNAENHAYVYTRIVMDDKYVVSVMWDSGSPFTLMSAHVYRKLYSHRKYNKSKLTNILGVGDHPLDIVGEVQISVAVHKTTAQVKFLIVEGITTDYIMGTDVMHAMRIDLLFGKRCLAIGGVDELPFELVPTPLVPLLFPVKDFVLPAKSRVRVACKTAMDNELLTTVLGQEYKLLPEMFAVTRDINLDPDIDVTSPVAFLDSEGYIVIELLNNDSIGIFIHATDVIGRVAPMVVSSAKVVDSSKKSIYSMRNEIKINFADIQDEYTVPWRQPFPEVIEHIKNRQFEESSLSTVEKEDLRALLLEYADVFAVTNDQLGHVTIVKHVIDTGDQRPVAQKAYKVAYEDQQKIQRHCMKNVKAGLMSPSIGPWANPVFIIDSKATHDPDGRMVGDFRKLNSITKKDRYPLPLINETLQSVAGSDLITTADACHGYLQIALEEKDKEKTALITSQGLFQWERMPWGLCNAPATFQRLMDILFADLKGKTIEDYIDDLCAHTKGGWAEHKKALKILFNRLRYAHMVLKLSKCKFGVTRVSFLGHIVGRHGIETDPAKVKSIQEMAIPKDLKQLRHFLGLAGYYRRFIKDYAKIVLPLLLLFKKDVEWKWTAECTTAFNTLRQCLMTAPILRPPNWEKPFILHTDANGDTIAGILSQMDDDGKEYVIAYYSRNLLKSERNYTITEKECLAVVDSIKHFRYYISGHETTVFTDHKALTWLLSSFNLDGRIARWITFLTRFNLIIKYRPGEKHVNVDAITRINKQDIQLSPEFDKVVKVMTINKPADWSNVDIREHQLKDPNCRWLMHYLETGDTMDIPAQHKERVNKTVDKYVLQEGVLYRLAENRVVNGKNMLLLVIPRSLVDKVMHFMHDEPSGSHFGLHKTYWKIKQRFYWEGMFRDVQMWIKTCKSCMSRKGYVVNQRGQLLTIPIPGPNYMISADIMGPFPISNSGNRFLLLITDKFTHWVVEVPLKNIDSDTVARAIVEKWICNFGVFEKFLTDRGPQFTSDVTKHICRLLGINKIFTSAYHPQGNGGSEAINKPFATAISMYCSTKQKDWDEQLPFIRLAYNTSVHSATGESPFYLTYGRDAVLPIESEFKAQSIDYLDVHDYRATLIEGLRKMYRLAKELSDKKRQMQEIQYAKQLPQPNTFQAGQQVYVYMPSLGRKKGNKKKLLHLWHGPYRILEMTSPVNAKVVMVKPQKRNAEPQIVHISRLKHYMGDRPVEALSEVYEEPEVEKIDKELVEQATGQMDIEEELVQQDTLARQELTDILDKQDAEFEIGSGKRKRKKDGTKRAKKMDGTDSHIDKNHNATDQTNVNMKKDDKVNREREDNHIRITDIVGHNPRKGPRRDYLVILEGDPNLENLVWVKVEDLARYKDLIDKYERIEAENQRKAENRLYMDRVALEEAKAVKATKRKANGRMEKAGEVARV